MIDYTDFPPRMSDEDLKAFVLGMCDGKIFTMNDAPPDLVPMCFLPLMFNQEALPKEVLDRIGMVWEWMSEAGPRGVNNLPIFTSCRLMHKIDWERAHSAILKELERRKNIEL